MTTSLACPQCGAAVDAAAERCPQCGAALAATPQPPVIPAMPPPPLVPPTPAGTVDPGVILHYGALQQAAIYQTMARSLRGIGIGFIVWGAIQMVAGIVIGIAFMQDPQMNEASLIGLIAMGVSLAIGLAYVGLGSWTLARPTAGKMQAAAIVMIVTGALYFLGGWMGILLAIILILYGVSLHKRHKRYGALLAEQPAPELLAEAGALLDRIQRANPKKDQEIVEFRSYSSFMHRFWRTLLLDNMLVVLVLETRLVGRAVAEVYFLPPAGLLFDSPKRGPFGWTYRGMLYIEEQKIKACVTGKQFERYLTWRQQRGLTV